MLPKGRSFASEASRDENYSGSTCRISKDWMSDLFWFNLFTVCESNIKCTAHMRSWGNLGELITLQISGNSKSSNFSDELGCRWTKTTIYQKSYSCSNPQTVTSQSIFSKILHFEAMVGQRSNTIKNAPVFKAWSSCLFIPQNSLEEVLF